jgi:GNAT superfamily N-acetyltransferase
MIRIRRMTAADIPFGMRLKEQAGWNQTEADWRRFLDMEPDGCFVAECDGTPVGTTTTCVFGPVAWIAMVLVDASRRGQGIGTAMVKHALAYLDAAGVASIRLDATPLGQPLYEKLGFKVQFHLARFDGMLPPCAQPNAIQAAERTRWDALIRYDGAATRTNRRKLLEHLFAGDPRSVRFMERDAKISGFLAVRQGSRAVQLGPCLADKAAGPLLLADASCRYAGQHAFLDVPISNTEGTSYVHSLGLTVQRQLARMCRGPDVREDIARLWASSGPEKG